MNILELYDRYKIPRNLQEHQIKVAALSFLIAKKLNIKENEYVSLILSLLLHDMGNILKFNFEIYPDLFDSDSKKYWLSVQKEYREKYGSDINKATLEIVKEIFKEKKYIKFKLNDLLYEVKVEDIFEILESIGFSKVEATLKNKNILVKIATYSDMRVGIYGVLPLTERVEEGRKRYMKNFVNKKYVDFDKNLLFLIDIENYLCKKSNSKIDLISENEVMPFVGILKKSRIIV